MRRIARDNCLMSANRGLASARGILFGAVLLGMTILDVSAQGNAPAAALSLTISPYQLSSYMRAHAKVLGDRLFQPGNERIALNSSISNSGSGTAAATITYDISGRLRIDLLGRSIGFDGTATWSNNGAVSQADFELIEALVNDSPEHLFTGQARHLATRPYGRAFRFDDGKAQNYTGPYYDVFEVVDAVPGTNQAQIRVYCINSRTYALERVQQDTVRAGKKVRVETVLGAWQSFGTQQLPTVVSRTENGQALFTLRVASASTGPTLSDGFLDAQKP